MKQVGEMSQDPMPNKNKYKIKYKIFILYKE